MKPKALLIIFVFILVCAGFYAILFFTNKGDVKNVPGTVTTGEITEGMQLGALHEIKIGDLKVEVGNKKQGKMDSAVTFSKKDNTSLGMSFPIDNSSVLQAEDNKITWSGRDKDVYFKNSTNGIPKYEFDILLKVKPSVNTFTYTLDTNNLEFAFNDKEYTYSAYKKGYQAETGIYNKGELFRIERPKITDAKGKETWGKLHIDTLQNKLSVTVESNWLASASYPVTVDPTVVLNDTNHVLITKIDRFRWKIAVEYEIRDDTGKLLGSDVVIMEANPGETASQFLGFFKDYLKRRSATWLLAQGNYTLYEMSNDRLSAVYFQVKDSGDDVKDEYVSAREARKQILESIQQQEYPTYSLTLEQASLLQNPNSPAFTIANEKPGGGTEILRPNGAGDASSFGSQWAAIDEAVADNGVTQIFVSGNGGGSGYGYFALQNTALSTHTVNSIDSSMVSWYSQGYTGGGGVSHTVRLGGTNGTFSPSYMDSWDLRTTSGVARPGGGIWAVADLNSLQQAILFSPAWEVPEYDDCAVTQGYVTVNWTPPPSVNIRGGTNFQGSVNIDP